MLLLDEIARLRATIDKIDQEILMHLKARSENAGYIGTVKRSRALPVRAMEREERVLRTVGRKASELGLDSTYTQNIFQDIIELAVRSQTASTRARIGKPPLSRLRCLIIGGTGGMGRMFVHMMRTQGAHVRVVGRNQRSTARAAQELGAAPAKIKDASRADIVIVAVPLTKTLDVALKAASFMQDGSLLSDLSSVKNGVSDRIAESTPQAIEYVSLHPLFGPQPTPVYGQSMIVLPYRKGRTWRRVSTAFKGLGLTMRETSAEEHDRTMAYVQGMHHFALASLGLALASWDGSFRTNSLRSTLERIQALAENRETIGAIQEFNPYCRVARADFVEIALRLSRAGGAGFNHALNELPEHVHKWTRKR